MPAALGEEGDPLAAVADQNEAPARHLGGWERDGFAPFEGADGDEAVLDDDGEALGLGVIKEREDLNGLCREARARGIDTEDYCED